MSEKEVPFLCLFVPDHIRVTGFSFKCDDRVSIVDAEGITIIITISKTLHLTGACGGVKSNDSVFSETGSVVMVNDRTSAEYCSESILSDSDRFVFPVDKVFGNRVSPSHILPFGAVRIHLVIKMPFTVFVKHSVRVVHPTIKRSVVENRTVFELSIRSVKCIGKNYVFPEGIVFCITNRTSTL